MKGFAFLLVLALAAATVQGAKKAYRHGFQYKTSHPENSRQATKIWKKLAKSSPPGGRPKVAQFGNSPRSSRRRSLTSYPNVSWPVETEFEGDMSGYLDFGGEHTLKTFFEYVSKDCDYKYLIKNLVENSASLQYVVDTCDEAPVEENKVWRLSIAYVWTNSSSSPIANAQRVLTNAVLSSPVPVLTSAISNDLGIGSELSGTSDSNYNYGGTLDFTCEKDATHFLKWLTPQDDYKELLTSVQTSFRTIFEVSDEEDEN